MTINRLGLFILLAGIIAMCSSCSNQYKAIGSADNEEIALDNKVLNLADYLRRVPQLHVRGTGENVTVQIRENGTRTGNASPLYVLDGTKVGRDYDRISRILDPNDIKSVKALTNASETSFYGLDGSSGVILIKTR